ncbi:cyclin-A1 [Cyprinodon tularosa]|uniref:cyclin-A1 n=1 Tax=Cyprinodon tularosa TaxID=77115 RepID=UPI0018E259F2|nr:cyclin-A1 [Cyprinodon tularosa]
MNCSTSTHRGSPTHKENIPPLTKADAFQHQRTKQRTVLGVLPENELRGRSLSQGSQFSKHSSVLDSSQLNFLGCTSSSSYEVYVEEACEVVLAASGQEVVSDSCDLEADTKSLQDEHVRLLMEFSSSAWLDASMHAEPEEPEVSGDTFCFDYADDIYKNLREIEKRFRAKPGHLERHPEITDGMRVILVDWLVEVVEEYKLSCETLHLAVNYLDRFLSSTAFIRRSKLQLAGTVALLVAAKYEETFPPELNEFVYITDCTYTKKQLLRMESLLLKVLDFNLAAPTTNQFLRLFMSVHSVCSTTENLALYIAELSLQEADPFLRYTPSILAAGAYCLATYTVSKSYWPGSLVAFSGYTMEEIIPCLSYLHKLYISAESWQQQAIRDKYKSTKFCRVSGIPPPAALTLL